MPVNRWHNVDNEGYISPIRHIQNIDGIIVDNEGNISPITHMQSISFMKSKLGFYLQFNSQGNIRTSPQHYYL